MKKSLINIINTLENNNAEFKAWLITIFVIISLRNLLEGIIEAHRLGLSANFYDSIARWFCHYPLLYLTQAMFLALMLYLITGEKIIRTAKFVFSFLPIICIVPIIDVIWSHGKGYKIAYFSSFTQLGHTMTHLLNPTESFVNVSPGIRIEMLFCIIAAATYVWIKTTRIPKTIISIILTYISIPILAGTMPLLIAKLTMPISNHLLNHNHTYSQTPLQQFLTGNSLSLTSDQILGLVYAIIFSFLLIIFYYCLNSKKFVILVKNARLLRVIHYTLLMLAGTGFASHAVNGSIQFFLHPADWISVTGMVIALFFLSESAIIVNDLNDEASDRISNKNRPLVTGELTRQEFYNLGILFFLTGSIIAFLTSYYVFLLLITWWGIYYIYSSPPLQIKRFFPFNMLLIVSNCLLVFMAGASLIGKWNVFSLISCKSILIVTIPYLLGINIITLKDIESDRASGVITLSVLLGKKAAKIVMAICCFLAAIIVVPLIGIYWLYIPATIFGVCAAIILLRETWNEDLFFLNYLAYFLLVCGVCLQNALPNH